ncbi:MAG: hypothetical protein B7C55_09410 [Actinomycetales bacterium mxb001]|nr:MAG: hypothetical protein B7C55_09410 [Actinomycetales bacterium mxb001]
MTEPMMPDLTDTAATQRRRRPRRRSRSGGEESATDPRGPRASAVLLVSLVVLVLVGLLLPAPSTPTGGVVASEPVDSSTAVCPEPGAIDGARTTSAMTVVPDLPGQDREGSATVSYLRGSDDPDLADPQAPEVDDPGEALVDPGDSAQVVAESQRLPPLEIRTTGSLGPGLVAAQVTQDSFDERRGLASTACLGPDTTWWFVGGGSIAGRESQLILVNPESTPAEIDVILSGAEGEITTPSLRGIVVEPRSRVAVRLTRVAPRLPAVVWHVVARSGRVVAAVSDVEIEGFVPRGADWIPPSADPATRVLIPGVIPGEGGRQLLVHAPGDIDATVKVRLITEGGSYVPAALSEVDVPAGTVTAVDLDGALEGQAATVDLVSDVPIVAGIRQRHPGIDARQGFLEETSFTAGAVAISDVAAAAALPAEKITTVTIWITAPGALQEIVPHSDGMTMDEPAEVVDDSPVTATITLLPFSPEGSVAPPDPIVVTVPRDRLVAVEVPRPAGAVWFTAVVRPVDGVIVVAHRSLRRNPDGALITGYPWRPLRTTVQVPRAYQDAADLLPR